jgi:hypothetical protein
MRSGKYMQIRCEKFDSPEVMFKIKCMDQEMEKLIWEYIDGHLSPAEKTTVMQHLKEEAAWQTKFNELMAIHSILQKEDLEMPSLRFTKNVMEEITKYQVAPATKNYINKNVIRGIASIFLIMIGGLFICLARQIHWTGPSTGHLMPAYGLEVDKLNWGKLLNNTYVNIFVGINVILGLILFDKYKQGRKNAADWSKGDSA